MKSSSKNISFYALILLIQGLIYHFTGRFNSLPFQAVRDLSLPFALDSMIPFVPETIWFYSLYYIILMSGFLLAFDHKIFPMFIKSFIIMSTFADLMFVIVPVSMPLQVLNQSGTLTTELFNLILAADTRSNCFPSLHCAHSFLITYWFYRSEKFATNFKLILIPMTFSVVVATLLAKQHWFVDIIGAFIFFVLLTRLYEKKLQNQRI